MRFDLMITHPFKQRYEIMDCVFIDPVVDKHEGALHMLI